MAPRDVQPGDNVRRSREDQTSARDFSGLRGSSDRPFHVTIDGADQAFYEAFRQPGGAGRAQQQRPADVSGAGFESILNDAKAIESAGKDITRQLKLAAEMASQFTRALSLQGETQRREQEAERQRVSDVLGRLENVVRAGEERQQRAGRSTARPVSPRASADEPAMMIPDVDNPNPDGSYPMVPAGPPGRDGGSGGGGGGGGGRGRGPRGPRGPGGPPPENLPAGPSGNDDKAPRPDGADLSHHSGRAYRLGHTTHGGLQRRARTALAEVMHQRLGEGLNVTPTVQAQHDENGNLTHYIQHNTDGSQERIASDDARVPGLLRSASRQRIVSAAAGGYARGGVKLAGRAAAGAAGELAAAGGLSTAVGMAAKAVPVVGWGLAAVDGVNSVAKFITEQRKVNAQYQAIYGGSNLEAIPERINEQGFVWGQRFSGGLTEEDSRSLFQGTSQLGYRGGQRDEMLDFASDQYKQLGQSISQSLQAISLASQNANSNLTGMTKGLKSASLAARATGQNAEALRDTFLQNYAVAAQAGLGPNASGLAAGLTNATQGVNRRLAGASFGGVGNDTSLRVMASQYGLDGPGALVAAENNGQHLIADSLDQGTKRAGELGVSNQAQARATQLIQEKGGNEAVAQSPGAMRDIGQEVMAAGFDPQIYANQVYAMTYGQVDLRSMDPSAIAEYYVKSKAGVTIAGEQTKAEGQRNRRDLSAGDMTDQSMGFGLDKSSKFVKDNTSMFGSLIPGLSGGKDAAVGAYGKRQQKTGDIDPVIEDLISNYGDQSEVGFEVETSDGKKTVSMSDAITYYSDQLAKGSATIVGGQDSGSDVKTALGYAQQDVEAADSTKGAAQGDAMTSQDWTKKHPTAESDAKGERGTVTISPSPELMRMFNFQTTGNAQVEGGAAAGVPPSIPMGPR